MVLSVPHEMMIFVYITDKLITFSRHRTQKSVSPCAGKCPRRAIIVYNGTTESYRNY